MKNTARKMLNMPFWAYCVQISTTRLLSSIEALVAAPSKLNVRLDELDGPIGPGDDGLRRCAGEPIDHRAAGDQAQQKRRVQQRQVIRDSSVESVGEHHDDRENSVVAPTTAVPISTGLAVALNVLPAPSLSSRKCLAFSKFGCEAEVALDFSVEMFGSDCDRRQLEDRLGVVGDRAVGIDGDRHRPHAQEAERDQAERKHARGEHQLIRGLDCSRRRR